MSGGGEYIETATGNRVSRRSVLCGTQNIHLHGKTLIKSGVIVRGDFANVRVGRHCVIGENTVIRPAYKRQCSRPCWPRQPPAVVAPLLSVLIRNAAAVAWPLWPRSRH